MKKKTGKLQKTIVNSKSVESAKRKTRQTRKQSVKYRRQLQNSLDSFTLDQGLRPFCTARQFELLTAWEAYGSKRSAAKALKINPKNFNDAKRGVERKAARQGYSPQHDLNHTVPDGFSLQGASTLYGAHGEQKLQWIKSAYDTEQQQAWFEEGIKAFAEDLKPIRPIKLGSKKLDDDLLCAYPVGDHHIGALALQEESGAEWNLKIAEETLLKSFAYLLGLSTAKHCLIPFMGDFLHTDSVKPVTPLSGNLLDTDTRFYVMVRTAIRIIRTMIESAATTHETVHIIFESGNHDTSSSIILRESLASIYQDNPRITVDTSPSHFHYYNFGKCLIGVTHGHTRAKLKGLPLIMAFDCILFCILLPWL